MRATEKDVLSQVLVAAEISREARDSGKVIERHI